MTSSLPTHAGPIRFVDVSDIACTRKHLDNAAPFIGGLVFMALAVPMVADDLADVWFIGARRS